MMWQLRLDYGANGPSFSQMLLVPLLAIVSVAQQSTEERPQQPSTNQTQVSLSSGLTYKCQPFKPNGHQNLIQKDGCPRDIYLENGPDAFTIDFLYNSTILQRSAISAAITIRSSNNQVLLPIYTAQGTFSNVSLDGIQVSSISVDCNNFNKTIFAQDFETIGQVRIAVTENFNQTEVVRTAVGLNFVIRQPQFAGNKTSNDPSAPVITIAPESGTASKRGISLLLVGMFFIVY